MLSPFIFLVCFNAFFSEVFEEVLEIVSYMTFFSPTISLEMWSLWPLMMEALADWAIDFFPSMSQLYGNDFVIATLRLLSLLIMLLNIPFRQFAHV